jgi:hypothetical protein
MAGNANYFRMDGADSERDLNKGWAATNTQFNENHPALAALHKGYKYVGDEGYDQGPKHPEKAGGFMK